MSFDLHNHSYYSDGTLSPFALVKLAQKLGLEGLSLSDHDTVNGIEEFMNAGRELGIICLPGVEVTTEFNGVELHILGYGMDYHHTALRRRLRMVIDSRIKRAREILRLLQKAGIDLSWNDLENARKNTPGGFIGRPHIYKALKEKGIIGEDPDRLGFNYYLGSQGVAYVPHRELSTIEALELISEAGGVPVLAHPGRLENYGMVKVLKENGLAGIEVFYPSHSSEVIAELLKISSKFELLTTGGSDFHGEDGTAQMGTSTVKRQFIEELLEKSYSVELLTRARE